MTNSNHLKGPRLRPCVNSFSDLPPDVCQSVSDVLARVGDKWSILVIAMLARGSMRFTEIKRSIESISQKVLTTTLRGLERDGSVSRKVTPSIPPRVDYELTDLGHDVLVPVTALAAWALRQREQVERARAAFDQLKGQAAHARFRLAQHRAASGFYNAGTTPSREGTAKPFFLGRR